MSEATCEIEFVVGELQKALQEVRDSQKKDEFFEAMHKVNRLSAVANQRKDAYPEIADSAIEHLRLNIATMKLRHRNIDGLDKETYESLEKIMSENYISLYHHCRSCVTTFSTRS